jgi:hypothetical protein
MMLRSRTSSLLVTDIQERLLPTMKGKWDMDKIDAA